GQVVAQVGFTRAIDVMTACALAAAVHATAGELGRQVDGRAFRGLHHDGAEKQLFLAPADTARGCYICLTVFDGESCLGLVRMYFAELCKELAASAPSAPVSRGPVLDLNFEQELNANLTALFAGSGKRDGGKKLII